LWHFLLHRVSSNKGNSVQILSYNQAAARIGVVRRTLERLISRGEGPPVVDLSPRRRGIIASDLDIWIQKRRRPAPDSKVV
jgi:predicted DNA-binding transcriptional regulator AlpA